MSHTPGTWKSAGTAMKMSNFDKTYRVAVTVDNGLEGIQYERKTVAYGVSPARKEAEANARLVAAAPVMLEMLKEVLIDHKNGDYPSERHLTRLMIEDTIQKIEGVEKVSR